MMFAPAVCVFEAGPFEEAAVHERYLRVPTPDFLVKLPAPVA